VSNGKLLFRLFRTVKVGKDLVESVITRRSAEELKLKVGDSVTAVIKATEVMIQKD